MKTDLGLNMCRVTSPLLLLLAGLPFTVCYTLPLLGDSVETSWKNDSRGRNIVVVW
jgi:hypothetical protein